uniref:Uncharacterized protein n=1 Tax=Onchocerca volvulus TaxID=6282 RepID=A0A8R1XSX1_ONCVO
MTLVKMIWKVVIADAVVVVKGDEEEERASSERRQIITGFSGLEQIFEDDEMEEMEIEKKMKHRNLVQQLKVSIIIRCLEVQ